MRELNFRIGVKQSNGFRYLDKDELFNLYRLNPYDGSLIVKDNGRNVVVPREAYVIEQSTGLKDKNGKKIYEGDIVEYKTCYYGNEKRHHKVVEWEEWDSEDFGEPHNIGYSDLNEYMEVIGNIHENKELLNEKNEH